MSYRNDHDAAVARVDALQHEVARLAAENDKLRLPAAPARKAKFRLGLVTVLGGTAVAAVGGLLLGLTASASGSPPTHEQPAPVPVLIAGNEPLAGRGDAPMSLAECAEAIAPNLVTEARKPLDVAALERTGASCRSALRTFANSDYRADDSVRRWADAEDRLANRISLLVVYYSADPAVLDGNASAPRLWTEYDAALTTRNAALNLWRSRR